MWPFVIGYDKEKKGIFLWIVNKNYCPYADIKRINKDKIDEIIRFLGKRGIVNEIKNKERFIWPYEDYQIKLKKYKGYFQRYLQEKINKLKNKK